MFTEYFRLAFQEIKANKVEVGLTMLGIVVGIAAVTLILSLGEGATQMVKNKIATYQEDVGMITYSPSKKQASNTLSAFGSGGGNNPLAGFLKMIAQAGAEKREKKEREWLPPFYVNEQKTELMKAPMVESLSYFARSSDTIDYYGYDENISINFTEHNIFDYLKESVTLGRFYSPGEVQDQIPVAMLKLPRKLYNRSIEYGGPLGSYVKVAEQTFRIIGIIEGSQFEIYVPYTFYPAIATLDDPNGFLVKFKKGGQSNEKSQALLQWTKALIPNGDFYQEGSNINLFNQVLIYLPKFTALMSFIAGVSLIVGGIGIMNSMISSVIKRTREIGIRKSIGAKKRTVITQFIIESILISGLGGTIGILLGVLLSNIILRLFKIPPVFPYLSVIYCVIFTLAIGIASGIAPAVKAARLDPIEALGHS